MHDQHSEFALVSMIVPTYNNEARIACTLESIIAQDYPNIEIIVVDDASTDATGNVAHRVLMGSKRPFKIIRREKNGGQSASRNTGLDAAKGKFVIFFDHDDLADKDFVSLLCNEAEQKNADMVFCGLRNYYKEEDRYVPEPISLLRPLPSAEDYLKAQVERKMFFCYVWCCLFKREFLNRVGLYFHDRCRVGEDAEFVLKALSANPHVSFVKSMPYIYVRHSGQQSEANRAVRESMKGFEDFMLSRWRAGRYMAKNAKSRKVRNYSLNSYIPDAIIKRFTVSAQFEERAYYEHLLKTLKHRKIRGMLLSTVRFFFSAPELFFKALLLLYFPNFYYWMRSRK